MNARLSLTLLAAVFVVSGCGNSANESAYAEQLDTATRDLRQLEADLSSTEAELAQATEDLEVAVGRAEKAEANYREVLDHVNELYEAVGELRYSVKMLDGVVMPAESVEDTQYVSIPRESYNSLQSDMDEVVELIDPAAE